MPLQKNQLHPPHRASFQRRQRRCPLAGGRGRLHPGYCPGDEAQVRIVKDCGRYAFGILDKLLTPSPDRIPVDCAVAGPCGGCSLRHMDYAAELRSKQESVADAFRRIGGLDVPVLDALPPLRWTATATRYSSRWAATKRCALHRLLRRPHPPHRPLPRLQITARRPERHRQRALQLLRRPRHPALRRGERQGPCSAYLPAPGYTQRPDHGLPRLHPPEVSPQRGARGRAAEQFSDIASVLINVNAKKTNVILGEETVSLYGPGYIEDTLCGVPVRLGPLSFYQVNTLAAERLYGIAAEYAQLEPSDVLLDLYCGMGSIGLSMADRCRELFGVEIVPEAIDSAKANAARMGDAVAAKSRFFCADAGQAAARLAAEGLRPDVIMLDPPRKGCDETTLSAVVQMSPRRVVYVSCNPSTAARDAAWLEEHGYHAEKVQPVDLFPRTRHCECVIALSKGEIDS